ncbi:MAG: CotH kinase family protein [Lachnospiraceae bacterium]|nr:CotH kinase family protein [Lachnospiraceae bacterium]
MKKHRIGKMGVIASCLAAMILMSVGCGAGNETADGTGGAGSGSGTAVNTTNVEGKGSEISGNEAPGDVTGAGQSENEMTDTITSAGRSENAKTETGTTNDDARVDSIPNNSEEEAETCINTDTISVEQKAVISGSISVNPGDGTRSEGPVEITFSVPEGCDVYYTLDGSEPKTSSKKYNGDPIVLKKTATVRTLTRFSFVTNEFKDGENPVSENTTSEKAETGSGSGTTSVEKTELQSFSFFIGEPDETLDDVCVGISASDLSRLNASPQSSTRYPVSVAMYRGGIKVFDETCGMNATGNTSAVYDKKSYRLKFTKEFGESKLHYKVFDDLDIDSFDSLVLRGGSQDNEDVIMKDELVPLILRQGNVVSEVFMTHYCPVNLYINGEYRGLYYIREHIDGHTIASHYGCKHEEVTVVEQCREVKCGSAGAEWTDLWNYVDKNDLRDPEAFEYVSSRVSLESVADYYIIQMWLHNIDPDNVRVYKVGDDKWRYALYDLDLTLNDDGSGGAAFMLGRYNKGLYTFNALVYKLLQNNDFMELFLSRMNLLFTTILSEEKVLPIIEYFKGQVEHDMERSCGLWGPHNDSSGGVYYINYSTWKRRVELFKSRFVGRTSITASEFVRLKGVSDELVREYLSGVIE